jgi:hypothetical protein
MAAPERAATQFSNVVLLDDGGDDAGASRKTPKSVLHFFN